MTIAQETVVFDVHDFKVAPMLTDSTGAPTYGALVDVPGIAEVSLDPNFITAQLKGDAKVMARKGRVDAFNVSATYGKLSLPVLKVFLGGAITANGATDANWTLSGDNSLPYFKAVFAINDLDVGLGSLHVTLWKAQLTGGRLLNGSSDNFGQPTATLTGIPSNADPAKFVDVDIYAAATPIS